MINHCSSLPGIVLGVFTSIISFTQDANIVINTHTYKKLCVFCPQS